MKESIPGQKNIKCKGSKQNLIWYVWEVTRRPGWWQHNSQEGRRHQREVGPDPGAPYRPQKVQSFRGF